MNSRHADLEQRLSLYYQAQASDYRCFLDLAAPLSAMFEQGGSTEPVLEQMNMLMDQIRRRDEQMAKDRAAWQSSGQQPGPELKRAVADVDRLIRQVMVHIGRAEQEAVSAKSRLSPQLSQESRRVRMHAAYASARKHS